jgi:restriction system protein
MGRIELILTPDILTLIELLAEPGEAIGDVTTRLVAGSVISHILQLAPVEFEALVGRSFERRGYAVEHCGGKGDEGIDLMATRGSDTIAIQCKRFNDAPVTPSQVRDFFGAMVAAHATQGAFVTTSFFTEAARGFAEAQSIELVDRAGLHAWLVRGKAGARVRACGKCGAAASSLGEWTRAWICATCKAFNSVP